MSLGLHLSNNWASLVLVGTEGDVLKPAAPFIVATPSLGLAIAVIAIQSAVAVIAVELLLRRRSSR